MPRTARSRISLAVCVGVLMLAAGLAGWAIGHDHGSSSQFVVAPGTAYVTPSGGTAYLGAHQPLDRQPRGFAYSFPPDILWLDATGAIHEGGRPPCIPYDRAVRVKKMEGIRFPILGASGFTVLWVQC